VTLIHALHKEVRFDVVTRIIAKCFIFLHIFNNYVIRHHSACLDFWNDWDRFVIVSLASAPKRNALYGIKSAFVKGQLQLLGPFVGHYTRSFRLVWVCLNIKNEMWRCTMNSELENFAMQTYSNEIILSVN
jgi:hypothetical protein